MNIRDFVQGALALGIVLPTVIAAVYGVVVPEWLKALSAVIVGYYFKGLEGIVRKKLKRKK